MSVRRLWRKLALAAVLAGGVDAYGQGFGPPGGFGGDRGGGDRGRGGRGGFTMSSDSIFDNYLQSYGGSGDALDYSRISPEVRQRADRMAQFTGGAPMPTSGVISRAQFKGEFDKRAEAMRARFGNGGGGPPMTPQALPPGGPQPGATMAFTAQPGMMAGPPGMTTNVDRGRGDRDRDRDRDRGGDRGPMSDEWFQGRFKGYDRNGDGRVTADEASGSMKDNFSQADVNRDGGVDFNEYKVYAQARMGGGGGPPGGGPPPWGGDPNQPQQWGGGPPQWGNWNGGDRGQQQQQEDPRPVVYRYGKLPKELPGWFATLDDDKDGQVGLYEWRAGKRTAADFAAYDLNADGFLTAEEYLRYRADKDEAEKKGGPAAGPSMGTRGGPPSREERKEEKKDDKRSNGGKTPNPFRD